MDRDAGVWTVPARRTKTNRRPWVPPCGRALEILESAQALGEGAGPLLFTHGGGKPLHDSRLCRLLREQGIAAVPHGFRSSFRDWAAEETDGDYKCYLTFSIIRLLEPVLTWQITARPHPALPEAKRRIRGRLRS